MTPLGLVGVLLAAVWVLLRRWDRHAQRERAAQVEVAPSEPTPAQPVPWWKRLFG